MECKGQRAVESHGPYGQAQVQMTFPCFVVGKMERAVLQTEKSYHQEGRVTARGHGLMMMIFVGVVILVKEFRCQPTS